MAEGAHKEENAEIEPIKVQDNLDAEAEEDADDVDLISPIEIAEAQPEPSEPVDTVEPVQPMPEPNVECVSYSSGQCFGTLE